MIPVVSPKREECREAQIEQARITDNHVQPETKHDERQCGRADFGQVGRCR